MAFEFIFISLKARNCVKNGLSYLTFMDRPLFIRLVKYVVRHHCICYTYALNVYNNLSSVQLETSNHSLGPQGLTRNRFFKFLSSSLLLKINLDFFGKKQKFRIVNYNEFSYLPYLSSNNQKDKP